MTLLPPIPLVKPPCFDTKFQWNFYRELCSYLRSARKLSPRFNFCVDCTPAYRDRMKAQGRCKFPGTTFKTVENIIVGERGK